MFKLKYLIIIIAIISISGFAFATNSLHAGDSFKESFKKSANTTAQYTGHVNASGKSNFFSNKDPIQIVGQIIQILLSLLGVIFLGLLIYGGYLWMMDRGEEASAKKAKDIIKNAIIGLAIVLAAYAITSFVMDFAFTAAL